MGISAQAMRWIFAQPWTGNARELSNAIERLARFDEPMRTIASSMIISLEWMSRQQPSARFGMCG